VIASSATPHFTYNLPGGISCGSDRRRGRHLWARILTGGGAPRKIHPRLNPRGQRRLCAGPEIWVGIGGNKPPAGANCSPAHQRGRLGPTHTEMAAWRLAGPRDQVRRGTGSGSGKCPELWAPECHVFKLFEKRRSRRTKWVIGCVAPQRSTTKDSPTGRVKPDQTSAIPTHPFRHGLIDPCRNQHNFDPTAARLATPLRESGFMKEVLPEAPWQFPENSGQKTQN